MSSFEAIGVELAGMLRSKIYTNNFLQHSPTRHPGKDPKVGIDPSAEPAFPVDFPEPDIRLAFIASRISTARMRIRGGNHRR